MFGTVAQALAWARARLAQTGEPLDAPILLAYSIGVDRAALITHPEVPLTPAQAAHYQTLIERRAAGEPVAYLTGTRVFYDQELAVTPAVLIPRPETEHLIEAALAWARGRSGLRIVDVGTGSGAIAITLAAHLPDAQVWAIDVSGEALAVASQNASRAGVANRITCVQSDLLRPLGDHVFDLIAANLPYIASDEAAQLPVARYEPHLALDGGPDGLDLIRRLVAQAPDHLAANGLLLLEIGAGQGEQVQTLAQAAFPKAAITRVSDYAGHDRVVCIQQGV